MHRTHRTHPFLALVHFLISFAPFINSAPSDSPRDADLAQSGYVGGDHNIGPASLSRFRHLWNMTFKPDKKHYARLLVHTLASGKEVVFTASTENIVRTIDATTGETMYERQVAPPSAVAGACGETISKYLGIMGTPVIYPEYDVALLLRQILHRVSPPSPRRRHVHAHNARDYREPGGADRPLNGVYYFYAVYLDGLGDVYKYPLFIDDAPAANDHRKIFLGGLVLQRPSLLAIGDVVYAGFGGQCDAFNYTGTLVAININTRVVSRWATQGGSASPWASDWTKWHCGGGAGIWQSGTGLASDGQDVYFSIDASGPAATNTSRTPIPGKSHQDVLSDSTVRVSLNDSGIQLLDFFRPADSGRGIGGSGVALLDSTVFNTTAVSRIAVATSREARMYVQDRDELGGYRNGVDGSDAVLHTIQLRGEAYGGIASYPLEGGYIYVNPENASLASYRFGAGSTAPFALAATAAAEDARWGGGIPDRDEQPRRARERHRVGRGCAEGVVSIQGCACGRAPRRACAARGGRCSLVREARFWGWQGVRVRWEA
ncbi:hypothetical protein PMIN04_002391 [Paraphaeosphaeria minitans]